MADPRDIEVVTPYARSLGIALDRWEDDVPVLRVEFSDAVLGRPGALHGGAISGLLETAGYGALRAELARSGRVAQMKPINITDRDYFAVLAEGKSSYLSGLMVSRLNDKQIFVFSRRLVRDGKFAGAAIISFDTSFSL